MIYQKLPLLLLTTMASDRSDTIDCRIAAYLLENPQASARLGIADLAKRCHVSTSSISRFCREIGLEDFIELQEEKEVPIHE